MNDRAEEAARRRIESAARRIEESQVEEAFDFHGHFTEDLHPRGRGGKFSHSFAADAKKAQKRAQTMTAEEQRAAARAVPVAPRGPAAARARGVARRAGSGKEHAPAVLADERRAAERTSAPPRSGLSPSHIRRIEADLDRQQKERDRKINATTSQAVKHIEGRTFANKNHVVVEERQSDEGGGGPIQYASHAGVYRKDTRELVSHARLPDDFHGKSKDEQARELTKHIGNVMKLNPSKEELQSMSDEDLAGHERYHAHLGRTLRPSEGAADHQRTATAATNERRSRELARRTPEEMDTYHRGIDHASAAVKRQQRIMGG